MNKIIINKNDKPYKVEPFSSKELLKYFRRNKKTNLPSVLMGVLLGYSPESTIAFLDRDKKVKALNLKSDYDFKEDMLEEGTGTSYGTIFYDTGFIPSNEEKLKDQNELIKEINERRFYKVPFEPRHVKQRLTYKIIEEELKSNPAYVDKCNETISFILYSNYNELLRFK